jgi:hypothetical protein
MTYSSKARKPCLDRVSTFAQNTFTQHSAWHPHFCTSHRYFVDLSSLNVHLSKEEESTGGKGDNVHGSLHVHQSSQLLKKAELIDD